MTSSRPATVRAPAPLRCSARILQLPKNTIDPIEDGAALSERTGRFAVADGASAGRDVHLWAQALVRAYIRQPPPNQASDADADADLRAWFLAVARQHAATLPRAVGPSWLDEGPGAVTSAYAAFLGLRLVVDEQGGPSWEAISVGDCCLLHVTSAGEVTAFPLTDPNQFSDTPCLVPGGPDLIAAGTTSVVVERGTGPVAAGDTLLLATDAVARWLLTLARDDPAALRQVIRSPRDDLRDHLAAQRAIGALDKDDLTLLTVRLRRSTVVDLADRGAHP